MFEQQERDGRRFGTQQRDARRFWRAPARRATLDVREKHRGHMQRPTRDVYDPRGSPR